MEGRVEGGPLHGLGSLHLSHLPWREHPCKCLSPVFQGDTLVFLPGIAQGDTSLRCALLSSPPGSPWALVPWRQPRLHTPGLLLGPPWGCLMSAGEWASPGPDEVAVLWGPVAASLEAWDKVLYVLGLTLPTYKTELCVLTLGPS